MKKKYSISTLPFFWLIMCSMICFNTETSEKKTAAKCCFIFKSPYSKLLSANNINFNKDTTQLNYDEFIGPFPSWLNVKNDFGAIGDGQTDDTKALQTAIDVLARGDRAIVLYLPAGTYLITGTLVLNNRINVSIIGEDPVNTILKWGGSPHGTMLQMNGTAYSKFDRITWDGNKIADNAVDQSWDGKKSNFDTSNEYADDVFVDVKIGIRGGALGHGFAETSILRDKFIRNTQAGVSLGNFNALDIWIRDCLFQDCSTGVTNSHGAGNFRLYNNLFENSGAYDIAIINTGGFSVRNNTSVNSNIFFLSGGDRNPATIIVEGNTIIDPVTTTAIQVANQGPELIFNNTIISRTTAKTGPVVDFRGSVNSDMLAFGNVFTLDNPMSIADTNKMEFGNKVVSRLSLKDVRKRLLPATAANFKRKIFEIPAGADAQTIQDIINKAALVSGNKPVVHLPFGRFNISKTIRIPPNSDLQFVGDGDGDQFASMLVWTGPDEGPVLAIDGPSKATIRNLTIRGNNLCSNIVISNADQPGSRIFLQEFYQKGGIVGLFSNQVDHTQIFAYDSQFSGLKKGINVIGGLLARTGKPAEGRTVLYSGAESNNLTSHLVSNGGNLALRDTWYEGGIKSTYANIAGNSIFTAEACKIATPQHTNIPSVIIHDFSGKATFAVTDFTDRLALTGDCSGARVLALGLLTEDYPFVADTATSKADLKTILCRTRDYNPGASHSGSVSIPDIGKITKENLYEMMGNSLNIKQPSLKPLAKGITDVKLYHVMSMASATGIDIEAGNVVKQ